MNWCPALKTILANEEVIDGKSERGGHPVVRKPMKQWMLKITEYADRLLSDLDKLDWPERTKEGQRNWIGHSTGVQIFFSLKDRDEKLEVFTTRPDTLFGVTFMVLSPEHPLVESITSHGRKQKVDEYRKQATMKSELDRKAETQKTGVFTGAWAIHPFTEKPIPVWIADYVLMDYGTGAIMAVPGHDERDFDFAGKFDLPVVRVLESPEDLPFMGEGRLCNSGFLDGLDKREAIEKISQTLEDKGLGQKVIQYKLRDWLFSRQRYWGEPFPIFYKKDKTGPRALDQSELPLVLPEVADYEPNKEGRPPLAQNKQWVEYKTKTFCGQRETDTMPGSAGSSWYFLRYLDSDNKNCFSDLEKQKYWMPVDLYVGGPEHTVGHLLYSRFWQKVLFDLGLASTDEPFKKLAHQGMLLGSDGEKMSKSRGNVINPDEVREEYGADALRCFILFLGPLDRDKPWNSNGLNGVRKFLERVWRLCIDSENNFLGGDSEISESLNKLIHRTTKKVGEDIENLHFNTAISSLMILVNEMYKQDCHSTRALKKLVLLLTPFAPHLCEEIWAFTGERTFASLSPWPEYDESLIKEKTLSVAVQVNGKKRGLIEITKNASQDEALILAKEIEAVEKAIGENPVKKVIYVSGRILNIIVK